MFRQLSLGDVHHDTQYLKFDMQKIANHTNKIFWVGANFGQCYEKDSSRTKDLRRDVQPSFGARL